MLDQQKIDMFIMTNQKYFPEEKIVYLMSTEQKKGHVISRNSAVSAV